MFYQEKKIFPSWAGLKLAFLFQLSFLESVMRLNGLLVGEVLSYSDATLGHKEEYFFIIQPFYFLKHNLIIWVGGSIGDSEATEFCYFCLLELDTWMRKIEF